MANYDQYPGAPPMGPQGQGGPGMYAPGPPGFGGHPPPVAHGGYPPPQHGPQRSGGGPSKALPIVVAAGLAVGVFGGLIIVGGTGPSSSAGGEVVAAALDGGGADFKDAGSAVASASATDAAIIPIEGTQAGADAATLSPRADAAVVAAAIDAGIPVDVSPPAISDSAVLTFTYGSDGPPDGISITVDGSPASGDSYTVALGGQPATVKIVARARGYRTWQRRLSIRGDRSVRINMKRPSTRGGPGGLIDL